MSLGSVSLSVKKTMYRRKGHRSQVIFRTYWNGNWGIHVPLNSLLTKHLTHFLTHIIKSMVILISKLSIEHGMCVYVCKNCQIMHFIFRMIRQQRLKYIQLFCLFQHHCRNCGEIFCNECSDNKMPLPSSARPVRVCDTCQTFLLQRYSSGKWPLIISYREIMDQATDHRNHRKVRTASWEIYRYNKMATLSLYYFVKGFSE